MDVCAQYEPRRDAIQVRLVSRGDEDRMSSRSAAYDPAEESMDSVQRTSWASRSVACPDQSRRRNGNSEVTEAVRITVVISTLRTISRLA